jgi:hypothetical protein
MESEVLVAGLAEVRRDWSQVQQLLSLLRDILSPKE